MRAILAGGRKAKQLARYSNDHELAARACKELELVLVASFQAPGARDANGLWRTSVHEKVQRARLPCGKQLPEHILLQMRTIQGVRNALAHDYDTNCIANRAAFLQAFQEIESYQAEVELSPYYGILRMLHRWRRLARWAHSGLERVRRYSCLEAGVRSLREAGVRSFVFSIRCLKQPSRAAGSAGIHPRRLTRSVNRLLANLARAPGSIRIHGENEQAAAKKLTASVHGGGT